MKYGQDGLIAENGHLAASPESVQRVSYRKDEAGSGAGQKILKFDTMEWKIAVLEPIVGPCKITTEKEWPVKNPCLTPDPPIGATDVAVYERRLGFKFYEIKDHINGVRVVFSDLKLSELDGSKNPLVSSFRADLRVYNNFYSFGMGMVGRSYNQTEYAWGFQSWEKTNEIKGVGNHYTEKFIEYDPRLGPNGRWNVDPLAHEMPSWSPYSTFKNNPIFYVDPDGRAPVPGDDKKTKNNPNTTSTIHEERVALNRPKASTVTIDYVRTTETSNSTTGEFSVDNGQVEGFIFEPAKGTTAETYTAGSDKQIAEGTYGVEPYSSSKYPDNYELQNVPGRSKILIHKVNISHHTDPPISA